MRRKLSKGKRNKVINKPSEETKTVEKRVFVIQRTPSKSSQHYLHDERWDILPKTDYTYARSGSYSPRFFGRKYVNPNMSRYRIRGKGVTSGVHGEQEDVDYDGYLSSEYSDDDRIDQEQDSDSDVSYKTVLEEGIELRSGKNLKTMKEILHEHDAKLQQSDIIRSVNRSSYTTSKLNSMSRSRRDAFNDNLNAQTRSATKKALTSKQNHKQYSQSEQKHLRPELDDYYKSGSLVDHSNVRSRRSLNTDFSTNTNLVQNNVSNRALRGSSSADGSYSKSGYDNVDDARHRSGYLQTVRKTVTEEYEDVDGGVTEKGAIEDSEKTSRSRAQAKRNSQNNIHLYGLDSEGEFSDSDSAYTRRSGYSTSTGSGYGGYRDVSGSVSTVTTIVTTITDTISTYTRPIITPVWNTVGEPVWNSVGRPVWNNICRPVAYLVMSVLNFTWLLLTMPFVCMARSVEYFFSWLWSSNFEEKVDSVLGFPEWLWHKVKYVTWTFVRMDAWLYKRRRRRGCCLCLPLLLLLPVLLAMLTGVELWSESRSALLAMFAREKASQVVINEKHQYFHHLNDEVRTMILQLQSINKKQLTAIDVEDIVYRIVGKETAAWKANLEGVSSEAQLKQTLLKTEQGIKLDQMQSKHDTLLAGIQDLEATIAAQKTIMADKGEEIKAESALYLAGLEEKLSGYQADLHESQKEYAALLARVNACCHNETYYLAVVKDNVNAIVAEMMSGRMSGNPTQDAFTEWLHRHYISREVLDKRLENLANELTASVVGMMKDLKEAQQQQYQEFEQQQDQKKQQTVNITSYGSGLGEQQVRQMIEEALFRYSADKTGMADYALESAGGTLISTKCSESYYRKTALVSVFGIPLWYTSNSPRTIIQPEVHPGQCWAFRGTQGYIVIQTSTTIIPSGFTLEHIPKSLAPSGEIDSAPKNFTVTGLESEFDDKGVSLGNYTYNDDGKPMQFFPVQVSRNPKHFILYELRIISNYGNQEYTCLYRFRIHGKPFRG